MAPLVYSEAQTTGTDIVAAIKQAILKSSDWAHLQLTTGTPATTLSGNASIGATSISTAASIPSGSYITIGTSNPEVRLTTGVSGAGPYTVTFANALASAYTSGATVGVGSIVKATTTRGAQMVLDLADAARDTTQMYTAIYRTHDGTTGTDKNLRYPQLRLNALTNTMRIKVSVSKEHLYVGWEGPRFGETGSDTSYGAFGSYFYMGDITPYHGSDTVPAVVCIMADQINNSRQTGWKAVVSRDQTNTNSWVPASILTLNVAMAPGFDNEIYPNMVTHYAKGDGKLYVWPYVVVEDRDGLRGRITRLHNAGWNANSNVNPQNRGIVHSGISEGTRLEYGGLTYEAIKPIVASGADSSALALAATYAYQGNDRSPLIAVPISEP